MLILSGADVVLADRIASPATIVVEDGRITDITAVPPDSSMGVLLDFNDHYIVPGFVDVHVHGVEGHDTLDNGSAVDAIAARLPRFGVVAFCPTTVACAPAALDRVLGQVRAARTDPVPGRARVLPAHLESNFVNPEFRGAQPEDCLRLPPVIKARDVEGWSKAAEQLASSFAGAEGKPASFSPYDVLVVIERCRPDVGIVTLAPELPGALELIRELTRHGHRISLGHSGATLEEGLAGIEAGAVQATHLFNRMPPLHHREPGLAGAVLQSEDVAAEVICDGYHVHPALVRTTVAAKGPSRVLAITDGTAGAGLPPGSTASLGGRPLTIAANGVYLEDGTLAGSVATMDGVFRMLVRRAGLSVVDAATVCSTTPARELGLVGHGVIARGAVADLVILDRGLRVVQTYIGGTLVYSTR